MGPKKLINIQHPQVLFIILVSSIVGNLGFALAAGTTGTSSEGTSSSQPLWSYQVKPNNYVGGANSAQAPYTAMPSLFDAFNGLSQRQGALTSSPILSILPIILIAAGGMLLLLPFLAMMFASPFGGAGGFGSYGGAGGFGYPQLGSLSKKRSLNGDLFGSRNLIDLVEHVTTAIDEFSRRYPNAAISSHHKRGKSLNTDQVNAQPANHKQAPTNSADANLSRNDAPSATGTSWSASSAIVTRKRLHACTLNNKAAHRGASSVHQHVTKSLYK